ncbi:L-piperidine-6-carboxylate dehydrogenase [Tundrisphaera sp. TA3]|uniref:L-piperidine-6-carboxylate dehydrogenase n=1 Tax=Tundrisphaera sp. TA3 TaxID=3435775 RepID=UPI003EB7CF69
MDLLRKFSIPDRPAATAIGATARPGSGAPIVARSPIDGATLATIAGATAADVDAAIDAAHATFLKLRVIPAPIRGELVRRIGVKLRERKADLAEVVTLEAGKITSESLGEVQEMIDICDFAVGLSRQLHGLTIASERPGHRMMEQYHPLGVVGVISAFNFPVAVWAWNAMLALVCGDPVVWKPSEKTPLTALATHAIVLEAIRESADLGIPAEVVSLVIGGREVGEALAASPKVPLVSATGSTRMGREVGRVVAGRFGRSILELGGNNAMIVAPSADRELAVRAITFSAFGTAGQRCTTLRRLIVHETIYDAIVPRIREIAGRVKIGDPRTPGTLLGPLIDGDAFEAMQSALQQARQAGGTVSGGTRADVGGEAAFYAAPAIVEGLDPSAAIVQHETFAPILYCFRYRTLDEAIAIHNGVPQGLSGAIFTNDVREAELFLSAAGSDCGIANVNIGTSGAEIGGAFGGEKETGGGRESGSDAWKAYMRRATNTVNYSTTLPLAQGVSFDVDGPDQVKPMA